ncbi:hypothetical protein HDU93_005632, partial [Gonapodya sp. JEL0774]
MPESEGVCARGVLNGLAIDQDSGPFLFGSDPPLRRQARGASQQVSGSQTQSRRTQTSVNPPTSLTAIQARFESNSYHTIDDMVRDLRRMFYIARQRKLPQFDSDKVQRDSARLESRLTESLASPMVPPEVRVRLIEEGLMQ